MTVSFFSFLRWSTHEYPVTGWKTHDETCTLCFVGCPSSILPCGHNFCRKCVDEWLKADFRLPSKRNAEPHASTSLTIPPPEPKNRQQCPICRGSCPRSRDAWDLLDQPDSAECREEMAAVILNRIRTAGSPG
uniref:RING-type domain-containing protein n=1 Tax=Mesocestoides corti TaxID=53468 RepID=A0A5K3EJJ0_MESCO